MKTKLSKIILGLTLLSFTGLAIMPTATVFADDPSSDVCNLDVPPSVKDAAGCNSNSDNLTGIVISILNIIIGLSGLIAVVFIIIGGIGYMTSAGDAPKLEKAKKTILYAAIGLAICALAFVIVNFAIRIIYSGNETT